jgi:hypothetical protein
VSAKGKRAMDILGRHTVRLATVLAIAFVASLTACTGAVTTGPTSPNVVPPKSPVAVLSPSGKESVGCDQSRPAVAIAAADWIVGPLSYPDLVGGQFPTTDASGAADSDGIRFYKVGTNLLPGHTVSVTIGDAARAYAGIKTERGQAVGYSTVTYTSCAASTPSSGPGGVWWVGGFTLVGRSSACVPLEVQVTGETNIRYVHLLIGRSSCS